MSVSWNNIHVIPFRTALFLARHIERTNGKCATVSRSNDRTDEIIRAVMKAMRHRVERGKPDDKPYAGFRDEEGGQLVYVMPGWTFSTRRVGNREGQQ